MSRFMLFSLVAFSVAILATASWCADAQDYPGYLGYFLRICAESAPYFALHPPVYYSLPVPRTYGYSPFSLSAGRANPGLESAETAGGAKRVWWEGKPRQTTKSCFASRGLLRR